MFPDATATGDGEPRLFFQLGSSTTGDVHIVWPDGAVSRLDAPTPGTRLTITRRAPPLPLGGPDARAEVAP